MFGLDIVDKYFTVFQSMTIILIALKCTMHLRKESV